MVIESCGFGKGGWLCSEGHGSGGDNLGTRQSSAVSFSDHQAHTDASVDPSNQSISQPPSSIPATQSISQPPSSQDSPRGPPVLFLRAPPLHHEVAPRPLPPAIQRRSALPCADAV
ncbi:hypothetical protein M0R45_009255 [Rubus argutus]|uniref:Uncharacterized protein n=1 Tax=Rubus argutus TaxID=59490 RepID=A0AAW1Y3X7_RUBAR